MQIINLPFYILKYITTYLNNDIDILYLISSCKTLYQYKDKLQWNEFPVLYYYRNSMKMNSNPLVIIEQDNSLVSWFKGVLGLKSTSNTNKEIIPTTTTDETLKYKGIPKSFKHVFLRSIQEYNLFKSMISDIDPHYTSEILIDSFSTHVVTPQVITELPQFFSSTITTLKLGFKILNSESINKQIINCEGFQIPSTVTTLYLGDSYRLKLVPKMIPESVTNLSIEFDFYYDGFDWNQIIPRSSLVNLTLSNISRHSLRVGDLHEGLETLVLGPQLNQNFSVGIFPKTLKYLEIISETPSTIEMGSLPDGLETLNIRGIQLDCSIPQTVKHLDIVKSYFSQNSDYPKSLETLYSNRIENGWILGTCLNLKVVHLLLFNSKIESGMFPDTVESLTLPLFNHPIVPNSLPKNLKSLELREFNQPLVAGWVPEGLEVLVMEGRFNQNIKKGHFPSTLISLNLSMSNINAFDNGSIPISLQSLRFNHYALVENSGIQKCNNLKILKITNSNYRQPIRHGYLPKTLTELYIPYLSYDTLRSGVLSGIEKLVVSKGILDDEKKEYIFNCVYLPSTLVYFDPGKHFNAIFSKETSLPSSLRTFVLRTEFNSQLPKNLLPSSLVQLYITKLYQQIVLNNVVIPPYCSIINIASSI
ncbi:hypothetical protein DLAC_05822 [Tieghemostelium lacteum]|uniref:Uncharacterized protein n=1 Tax=Tieghemostelium lacteum TaxID=361077 RepID=A0A151ZGU0_TIELA|nr:hypothetical protein DLAC_05822 [Tieghemostelium lacteum]|eukprot:KYQ93186.1 hypothetical protein DLAC_05822 [Tieghemostelium lacteum]